MDRFKAEQYCPKPFVVFLVYTKMTSVLLKFLHVIREQGVSY